MRFGSLMSIDRNILEQQISTYLDPKASWLQVLSAGCGPIRDAGGFSAAAARVNLLSKETYSAQKIRRYSLYPLDNRWAYWTSIPTMWNRARPQLVAHAFEGNRFLVVRMTAERPDEGIPVIMTSALPDYHLLRPNVVAMPLMIEHHEKHSLFDIERHPNLSPSARNYLTQLGITDLESPTVASLISFHVLATCFSQQYLTNHRDAILADWPRVPMPSSSAALKKSAALGERIAGLLDPDTQIAGVTQGKIEPVLARLAVLSRTDGKPLKPADLALSAGWGYRTKTGVIMPGSGRVKICDSYTPEQCTEMGAQAAQMLGPPIDVALNDIASWQSVPSNVWEYRIGGYQVVKKWLSYREEPVLGRPLTKDEAREVTNMVRRLAAIILMTDELNANYSVVRDSAVIWSKGLQAKTSAATG